MIILDTNVLSELLTPVPSASVENWIGNQQRDSLFTTSITQAEMIYGVHLLPPGKRRNDLEATVLAMFDRSFIGKFIPFDHTAAVIYGKIAASRRRAGRPISILDAQIAAIALSRGARLATRNVRDFEGIGLALIDPWAAASPLTSSPGSRTPRRP